MLVERLSSHPHVTCYPALFSRMEFLDTRNRLMEALSPKLDARWLDPDQRSADAGTFLDEVIANAAPTLAFGLKQHLVGPEAITQMVLDDPDWKIIHIRRPNYLASYSSAKIVAATGQGSARIGEEIIRAKVEFDAREMDAHVRKRERVYAQWGAAIAASAALEVTYPDAASRQTCDRIWSFLGLDPARGGKPQTLKRQPSNILLRFSNPVVARNWLEENGQTEWAGEYASPGPA